MVVLFQRHFSCVCVCFFYFYLVPGCFYLVSVMCIGYLYTDAVFLIRPVKTYPFNCIP